MVLGLDGTEDDPDVEPSQRLQYFDPAVPGWGQLGGMGVRRPFGCGTAAVGPRVYAFGGQGMEVEEPAHTSVYDAATRETRDLARPPRALQFCAGVACDGLVYCLGGWDVLMSTSVAGVCVYNPAHDSWVPGPPLPLSCYGMAVAEHMRGIYVCGGWAVPAPGLPPSGAAAVLMLDPRTRAWASLPAMPTCVADAGGQETNPTTLNLEP